MGGDGVGGTTRPKPMTLTDGVAAGDSTLSGLEIIQRQVGGTLEGSTMAATMAFRLVEAKPGHAVIRAIPNDGFLNLHGTVHGGWAATLLDSALGCAVVTTLDAGQGAATVELSTRFLRPIMPSTGPVRVTGRVLNRGRRLVVAEGTLVSEKDGKLLGQATGTWMVLERD
jgi:uncharacterized protein (TIGR00369 family)